MLAAASFGLAFPYGTSIPNSAIIVCLAGLIFLSCFKITAPLQSLSLRQPLSFCIARYILIPMGFWALCHSLAPAYATGILLLALCPSGASAPAFTGIYNGNVGLSFIVTMISSLLCVASIPLIMGAFAHQTIAVPVFMMMKTLLLCIVLPGICYLALSQREFLKNYSQTYGRLTSVLLISSMVGIVLTKKRDYILANPRDIFIPFVISVVFYGLASIAGFALKTAPRDRIAYATCSAFNNNGLGIGIAMLYFDQDVVALFLATEFVWSVLPMFFQPMAQRLLRQEIDRGGF